ncbi:galactose oxidase [Paraglaciecola sp. L3A3]|uniref:Kelch repeat-containing protein n=1 Tax=Paraglaciecola sp. L3A3 TaxID=2686358 RepID=UPI00131DA51C|nr:galactose oxidase [Paraglaciecola sp. L3A3]
MKNIINLSLKNTFVISLCVMSSLSCAETTEQWIDKNENENYTPRHECSFVQAGEKFIMFGGRESAKKLDVYDYKTDSWSTGGLAPKEFNHFQATTYKGFIWVIGSFKTNSFPKEIPEDNIWLYHPPSQKWIQGPEIPENRRRGGAGLVVYKDKFYLVGGNTIGHNGGYVNWFDEYDPTNNTWTVLENAPNARDHFFAAVIDNKLYAAGGRLSGGQGGVFTPLVKKVNTYNFDTKTWSSLAADLPTPRAAPGIAVFNNELLVMGGEGEKSGPAYKRVEAYNTINHTWSRKPDMHYPRHGTQTIVSGKGIYIAGGSPIRGGGSQKNMEVFNQDSPAGEKLVSSTLNIPVSISITAGANQKIVIQNSAGNTASFISSVTISGKDSDKFKIKSDLDFKLVDINGSLPVIIEHTGTNAGDTAQISITYNGDKKISSMLSSH